MSPSLCHPPHVHETEKDTKPETDRERQTDTENETQTESSGGVYDIAKRVGSSVVFGVDFVGEVIADFLGITDSKYQYVVNAYARHHRRLQHEKEMRDAARERRMKKERERREEEDKEILKMEVGDVQPTE